MTLPLPVGWSEVSFVAEGAMYTGRYRTDGRGPSSVVHLASGYAQVSPRQLGGGNPRRVARMMLREAVGLEADED